MFVFFLLFLLLFLAPEMKSTGQPNILTQKQSPGRGWKKAVLKISTNFTASVPEALFNNNNVASPLHLSVNFAKLFIRTPVNGCMY